MRCIEALLSCSGGRREGGVGRERGGINEAGNWRSIEGFGRVEVAGSWEVTRSSVW